MHLRHCGTGGLQQPHTSLVFNGQKAALFAAHAYLVILLRVHVVLLDSIFIFDFNSKQKTQKCHKKTLNIILILFLLSKNIYINKFRDLKIQKLKATSIQIFCIDLIRILVWAAVLTEQVVGKHVGQIAESCIAYF